MRILNRMIVASALVVPMGLGVSGIAVADVAAGSSVLPPQITVVEEDDPEHCADEDKDFLSSLTGGGGSDNGECERDDHDREGNNSLLS